MEDKMSQILISKLVSLKKKEYMVEALKNMGLTCEDVATVSGVKRSDQTVDFRLSEKKSIGFSLNKDGHYNLVADFWRTGFDKTGFVRELNANYQRVEVINSIPKNWRVVSDKKAENGDLVITLEERI
jgi:hypothetical protein